MTTLTSNEKLTYIRNDVGHFVCPDCGEIKPRQNTMFYHMKNHAGDRSYICTEPGCDKAFIQKSGLQQHRMQAHPTEGAQLYICSICPIIFKTKANLQIHIGRKHGTGWIPDLKDGTCTGCTKQFSSTTAYYYHAVQCFRAQAPESVALA